MSYRETEARTIRQAELAHAQALSRNPKGFLPENLEGTPIERVEAMGAPYLAALPPKPASKAPEPAQPDQRPPYVLEVEVNCDECSGSGFDPGGVDPWGPEPYRRAAAQRRKRLRATSWPRHFRLRRTPIAPAR